MGLFICAVAVVVVVALGAVCYKGKCQKKDEEPKK